ncbi:glycosyltransferase family 1 protein [Spirulina major CS-329]|uniref:glycosyltransferase family 4 protein n=1 Tax=Spirulina TaxID=1154 RepID=UPI00232AE71E|nr:MULTISPECIES: glycosyltransferase family 1 protein [Spirulina]MDB9494017.1 glycosyltransferase family 1 protein [Spirulina subsalsa CS-330]MDB9502229.1 glycosyltransferase family 1 protein [Spirulina major CS-329]
MQLLDFLKIQISIALEHQTNSQKTPQLLVDISELVQEDVKSGIQRVVRSITLEFLKNPPDGYRVEPIYFDGQTYRYARHFTHHTFGVAQADLHDRKVAIASHDIFLGLDLNFRFMPAITRAWWQLKYRKLKIYFIVYDILLIRHPEWWPPGADNLLRHWLVTVAEIATGLICISKAVADDVTDWLHHESSFRHPLPQIDYFHLGADIENSVPTTGLPENAETVLTLLKKRPSFLMVGTLEPRKGHQQALDAFELLWQDNTDINLVIVGKEGWLVESLIHQINTHPKLNQNLFWLQSISDEYLEKVYAASTALLAASYGEGFGLPLIEAARRNLPIIARDIPVFREVIGENGHYFIAQHPEHLAESIRNYLAVKNQSDWHTNNNSLNFMNWKKSCSKLQIIFSE